jgi:cysteinyl-tRNA synthetase
MSVRIFDSQARRVVPLTTREPGRVGMYYCGPTVYNRIHIGNARTTLWFDMMRRYLAYRGFDVTYVMNYTDVDDKIIARAAVEGIPPDVVAKKYSEAFEDVMRALRVDGPDILCRATDHIDDMVEAIGRLIERGYAYESGGDVFFAIEKFPGYGKLSGRSIDEMREGARVEPHENKRHPLDFALWKAAKEGEPSWWSPWGPGRPGWHIECSVMSTKYLGMGFDVHGGGSDLIFPHHENEIAQAEALEGTEPFVRHWLHAGMVQMDAEKMSKSLGNFVLADEVVAAYGGEVVRYWALSGSYRTQVAFTEAALDDAKAAYERWKTFLHGARHALGDAMRSGSERSRREDGDISDAYVQRFIDAMDDDFNSPEAFAVIHELVRDGNKRLEGAQRGDSSERHALLDIVESFVELTRVLGFRFDSGPVSSDLTAGLIEYLIELRAGARAERAFDRADGIRAKLAELGVALEDTPAGTRWRLTRHEPGAID